MGPGVAAPVRGCPRRSDGFLGHPQRLGGPPHRPRGLDGAGMDPGPMGVSSLRADDGVTGLDFDLRTGTGMNTTHADARLAEVKQRVATGDYVVDASLVANAMLEQVRL